MKFQTSSSPCFTQLTFCSFDSWPYTEGTALLVHIGLERDLYGDKAAHLLSDHEIIAVLLQSSLCAACVITLNRLACISTGLILPLDDSWTDCWKALQSTSTFYMDSTLFIHSGLWGSFCLFCLLLQLTCYRPQLNFMHYINCEASFKSHNRRVL